MENTHATTTRVNEDCAVEPSGNRLFFVSSPYICFLRCCCSHRTGKRYLASRKLFASSEQENSTMTAAVAVAAMGRMTPTADGPAYVKSASVTVCRTRSICRFSVGVAAGVCPVCWRTSRSGVPHHHHQIDGPYSSKSVVAPVSCRWENTFDDQSLARLGLLNLNSVVLHGDGGRLCREIPSPPAHRAV